MDSVIERSIDGLSLGVIYSLISVAYSFAYGAGRPWIFASGAVYLIGIAVSASVISAAAVYGLGSEALAVLIALIAAIVSGGIAGWAIGRCLNIQIGRHSALLPLVACAGLLMIAAGSLQFVREWRFPNYAEAHFARPLLLFIPGLSNAGIALVKPTVVLVGAIAIAMFLQVFRTSSFGRAQRAFVQDRQMAELLGLNVRWACSLSILIASALAVLAGWMTTISQGQVDLNGGFLYVAGAFCAAIMGGLRSPRAAALAGFLAGSANALWSSYFGSNYAGIATFAFLLFALIIVQPALTGRRPVEEV